MGIGVGTWEFRKEPLKVFKKRDANRVILGGGVLHLAALAEGMAQEASCIFSVEIRPHDFLSFLLAYDVGIPGVLRILPSVL